MVIDETIKFLFDRCVEEGGDGWVMWYVRPQCLLTIQELVDGVNKFNKTLKYPWTIHAKDKSILFSNHQESILITLDEEEFNYCMQTSTFHEAILIT